METSQSQAPNQFKANQKKKTAVWSDEHHYINDISLRTRAFRYFKVNNLERNAGLISLASYFFMSLSRIKRQGIKEEMIDVDLTESFWFSRETIAEHLGLSKDRVGKLEQAGARIGLFKIRPTGRGRFIAFGHDFINFVKGAALIEKGVNKIKKQPRVVRNEPIGRVVRNEPIRVVRNEPIRVVRYEPTEVTKEFTKELFNLRLRPAAYKNYTMSPYGRDFVTLKNYPLYRKLQEEKLADKTAKKAENRAVEELSKQIGIDLSVGKKNGSERRKIYNRVSKYFKGQYDRFDYSELWRFVDLIAEKDIVEQAVELLDARHGRDKPTVSQYCQTERLDDNVYVDELVGVILTPPRSTLISCEELPQREEVDQSPEARARRVEKLKRIKLMLRGKEH